MDDHMNNHTEQWSSLRKEYDAKADRLSAEARLRYNDMFDDFEKEVDAAGDWTSAAWQEFTAKVEQAWQSLQDSR